MRRRIAVIGAGVAGALCARKLAEAGERVEVFDKGRSVGGRLAQRRAAGAIFDHGAQFAKAHDRIFGRLLEAGVAAGVIDRWPAAETDGRPVYIGKPSMSGPLELLLAEVKVHTSCRIDQLERAGDGWRLTDEDGGSHGPFAAVAIAVPAPQAQELLLASGDVVPTVLLAAAKAAKMAPCWALMLAFEPPLRLEGYDARPIEEGPLRWIARNTTKAEREGIDAWTAHASPEWSVEHLGEEPAAVASLLLDAFREVTNVGKVEPCHIDAHRWRYAMVTRAMGEAAIFDQSSGLGICGDWCLGGRIEAAFLSGRALARAMRET